MSPDSESTLRVMDIPDPDCLRWQDLADVRYSDEFCASFSYQDTAKCCVTIEYEPQAETLCGFIEARGLKPWFAYQIKLVGAKGIVGTSERANRGDVATWSSYQLGRLGRWWCEDCRRNMFHRDMRQHLRQGHTVKGYVLFDWFVTDARGNCTHSFSLDSSLHVLWRVGQRERERNDTPPRWYEVAPGAYAYSGDSHAHAERVGLYAEWEPGRPLTRSVRLPRGEYHVRLNLTEESFHANLSEEVEAGGLWAWVLDADLRFRVEPRREVAQAPR